MRPLAALVAVGSSLGPKCAARRTLVQSLTECRIVNVRVRIAPVQPVGGVVRRYLQLRVDFLHDVETLGQVAV